MGRAPKIGRRARNLTLAAARLTRSVGQTEMKLEAIQPREKDYRLVDDGPTPQRIESYVRGLPWKDITIVRIKKDDENWVECSGAHGDGFCVICREGAVGRISADEPESLDQLILILQDYSTGSDQWKEMMRWQDHPIESKGSKSSCLGIVLISLGLFAAVGTAIELI